MSMPTHTEGRTRTAGESDRSEQRVRAGRRYRPRNGPLCVAGGVLLILHGMLHLIGTLVLWHAAEFEQLRFDQARPRPGTWRGALVGVLWLAAAAAFALAGRLLIDRRRAWTRFAAPAALVSSAVIAPVARRAPLGLALSVAVFVISALLTWNESGRPRQEVHLL